MVDELVIYDLETGGFDERTQPILQVAAIAYRRPELVEIDALEMKVIPSAERLANSSPEALEVNGYDADLWEREGVAAGPAREAVYDFFDRHARQEMISKRTGRPYYVAKVAAHNVEFDGRFLRAWFADSFLPAGLDALCTLQLARWASFCGLINVPDCKLETLANHFGIAADFHDALGDVRATAEVLRNLLNLTNMRGESNAL